MVGQDPDSLANSTFRGPAGRDPLGGLREAFAEKIDLPRGERTLFHVSAGLDCRPLVYFSRGFQEGHGASMPAHDLVIQTCLGMRHLDEIVKRIRQGIPWFEDEVTRVSVADIVPLTRRRKEFSAYDRRGRRHVSRGPGNPLRNFGFDAFFGEAVMRDKRSGHEERAPLLYLFAENIATFEALVVDGPVQVSTLVATREGLGFGGCRKSVIDYIYVDHAPDCLRNAGFEPETVVTFTDVTDDRFRQGLAKAGIRRTSTALPYLPEGRSASSHACVHTLRYPEEKAKSAALQYQHLSLRSDV